MVAVLVAKGSQAETSLPSAKKRRSWRSEKPANFLISREQVLELVFFRRIFERLRLLLGSKENGELEVPLPVFQRVFSRLFRLVGTERNFSAKDYDTNGDGSVEWAELLDLWRRSSVSYELSTLEMIYIVMEDPNCCLLANFISKFVLVAIVTSTMCFIFATMPSFQLDPEPVFANVTSGEVLEWLEPKPLPALNTVETVCIVIFTVEYLVRVLTCWAARPELLDKQKLVDMLCDDEPLTWSTPFSRTFNFVTSPANMVDLISIVPFYAELILGNGPKALVVLRAVKLARVFRVMRVAKYGDAMSLVAKAMKASTQVLWVLAFNVGLGVIVFSAILYNIEGGRWNTQERYFERHIDTVWQDGEWKDNWASTPFFSIPATFWWCFVTCTTVGYGDDVPKSVGGQITATVTALWGVIMLALPIGVVANNFTLIYHEQNEEKISNALRSKKERAMLVASLSLCDQVAPRSQLTIEVYDDYEGKMSTGSMAKTATHDFLGSVILDLILPADQKVIKREVLPLQPDNSKARRSVTGKLFVEYEWRPRGRISEDYGQMPRSPSIRLSVDGSIKRAGSGPFFAAATAAEDAGDGPMELDGDLLVRIVRGENLLKLDWKPNGDVDPYCIVKVFRTAPKPSGELIPEIWRTRSVRGSAAPEWNEERLFPFEACSLNSQIYNPEIHGPLDAAASYYAQHGSLVGYKHEGAAAVKRSERAQADRSDLRNLKSEMRDLRRAVDALVKVQSAAAVTGSTLAGSGMSNSRAFATTDIGSTFRGGATTGDDGGGP